MTFSLPTLLLRAACLAALAAGGVSPAADKGSWPQFLGPDRTGISQETGLLGSWPEGGPKEVWRVPAGVGMSGLAIDGGRLITMFQDDTKQYALALDAASGKKLWQTPVAPRYKNPQGDGPRATPTIVGERVFVYTGQGFLVALNAADGKQLWSHDVPKALGGEPAEYGMACSPLVAGEQVIVTAGAPRATLAAYDAATGKLAWTAGSEDPAGYSSPALLEAGGRRQVVAMSGAAALGIDPAKGTILWRHAYETEFNCNTATPVAVKGHVFISSGENHGSVLLALAPKGDEFEVRELWSSQGTKSVLRSEWQTSVLLDGYLYGMDNVGSAGPVTHLTCIKADTGERAWQKLRFGKGNFIAADGKLFLSTIKGELVVVKATPKGYEEIGRKEVLGFTRQAPALAGGLLYLRDDAEIVCLDVRK
jgi:outer membrane protein assembly factor BamB